MSVHLERQNQKMYKQHKHGQWMFADTGTRHKIEHEGHLLLESVLIKIFCLSNRKKKLI